MEVQHLPSYLHRKKDKIVPKYVTLSFSLKILVTVTNVAHYTDVRVVGRCHKCGWKLTLIFEGNDGWANKIAQKLVQDLADYLESISWVLEDEGWKCSKCILMDGR